MLLSVSVSTAGTTVSLLQTLLSHKLVAPLLATPAVPTVQSYAEPPVPPPKEGVSALVPTALPSLSLSPFHTDTTLTDQERANKHEISAGFLLRSASLPPSHDHATPAARVRAVEAASRFVADLDRQAGASVLRNNVRVSTAASSAAASSPAVNDVKDAVPACYGLVAFRDELVVAIFAALSQVSSTLMPVLAGSLVLSVVERLDFVLSWEGNGGKDDVLYVQRQWFHYFHLALQTGPADRVEAYLALLLPRLSTLQSDFFCLASISSVVQHASPSVLKENANFIISLLQTRALLPGSIWKDYHDQTLRHFVDGRMVRQSQPSSPVGRLVRLALPSLSLLAVRGGVKSQVVPLLEDLIVACQERPKLRSRCESVLAYLASSAAGGQESRHFSPEILTVPYPFDTLAPNDALALAHFRALSYLDSFALSATLTRTLAWKSHQSPLTILSGPSDPVLVEIKSICNPELKRITFFVHLSNRTASTIAYINVIMGATASMLPVGEELPEVANLAPAKTAVVAIAFYCVFAEPCRVSVQLLLSSSAERGEAKNGYAAEMSMNCASYPVSLNSFMLPLYMEPHDFQHIFPRFSTAFRAHAMLSGPDALASFESAILTMPYCRITKLSTASDTLTHWSFACLSWFEDLMCFTVQIVPFGEASWSVAFDVRSTSVALLAVLAEHIGAWLRDVCPLLAMQNSNEPNAFTMASSLPAPAAFAPLTQAQAVERWKALRAAPAPTLSSNSTSGLQSAVSVVAAK